MAIDLKFEKTKRLSTQDIYDILDFSMQAAEDNGFLNSFIYNRAIYLFASLVFYPERKEELSSAIATNINSAWDMLIDDGTIQEMEDNYHKDLDNLAECGQVWFEEFTAYAHSARGLLNTIQEMSGDIVRSAAEQLSHSVDETGAQQILEIADKWGMNNTPADIQPIGGDGLTDSLFEE